MDGAEKILKILKGDEVREKLIATLSDANTSATVYFEHFAENPEYTSMFESWDDAWGYCLLERSDVPDILANHVFKELMQPHLVTPDDLCNLFYELFGSELYGVGPTPEFDDVYWAFLCALKNQVLTCRCSAPFPVAEIPPDSISPEYLQGLLDMAKMLSKEGESDPGKPPTKSINGKQTEDQTEQEQGNAEVSSSKKQEVEQPLWERNGIRLVVVGRRHPVGVGTEHLYAKVEGRMSSTVLHSLELELARLVSSILKSAGFLADEKEPESVVREHARFIRTCLDAYYTTARSTRDTFERRIRNAVSLLAESDGQANHAVGLALSVAAMEALLGERRTNDVLSARLATNVAVLLEPELSARGRAESFVKDIYDKRSRALHGEQIEGDKTIRDNARRMVAAVLLAVISRRDFMIRGGFDPETPDGLLRELRGAQYQGGPTVGVERAAYNVRDLWR